MEKSEITEKASFYLNPVYISIEKENGKKERKINKARKNDTPVFTFSSILSF